MTRKKKTSSDKKKASDRLKLRRDVLRTLADDALADVAGGAGPRDSMCRPTYNTAACG